MSIRDLSWSPSEKKIARAAYDKAYQNEMREIKSELEKKVKKIDDLQKVWKIHNYLTERRSEVDSKYDYRYSVLIMVFGRLLSEGYLEEKDLEGLSEDKINFIKNLSS